MKYVLTRDILGGEWTFCVFLPSPEKYTRTWSMRFAWLRRSDESKSGVFTRKYSSRELCEHDFEYYMRLSLETRVVFQGGS